MSRTRWSWTAVLVLLAGAGVRADEALRTLPLPLGETWRIEGAERRFDVFVQTRYGGPLVIETSSGTVDAIEGPDGRTKRLDTVFL